jgi:hypothetical protein
VHILRAHGPVSRRRPAHQLHLLSTGSTAQGHSSIASLKLRSASCSLPCRVSALPRLPSALQSLNEKFSQGHSPDVSLFAAQRLPHCATPANNVWHPIRLYIAVGVYQLSPKRFLLLHCLGVERLLQQICSGSQLGVCRIILPLVWRQAEVDARWRYII